MGPVLCCLDESEAAPHVLHVAEELARRLGLELVLVHVAPPPAGAPGLSAIPAGYERLLAEEIETGQQLLERLSAEAGLPTPRTRATVGDPSSFIVSICEEEGAGLVVLGSRGRGELASALLGSVSTAVAARAPCPCVVVSPQAAKRRGGSQPA